MAGRQQARILQAARATLEQHASLCRSLPSDSAYQHVSAVCGASIGQHTRHVLDHFNSCAAGFIRQESAGCYNTRIVRYDLRARDTSIETDRNEAIELATSLQQRISGLSEEQLQAPVSSFAFPSFALADVHWPPFHSYSSK